MLKSLFFSQRTVHLVLLALDFLNIWKSEAFSPKGRSLVKRNKILTLRTLGMAAEDVAFSAQVMDSILRFKPLFNALKQGARKQIQNRLTTLGTSWHEQINELLKAQDQLQLEYQQSTNKDLVFPEYYKVPFHAYDEGNLCWDAAIEVEAAALSVHSPIYAEKGSLELEGDAKLRSSFHDKMMNVLTENNFKPKSIVDLGCSTGLSTMRLHKTFPEAEVIGVDLSPYMVAVARHRQKTRELERKAAGQISYLHGMAEDTGLPEKSADLVSICLVNHELPTSAAQAIFAEARRIVKPGGAISIMDMNCNSPAFQKLAGNPFAFAGFKSTEPYLQEYANTDLAFELQKAGFKKPKIQENSPRHHTIVSFAE